MPTSIERWQETDKYNNCVGICPLLAGVSFVSFKTADII
jgi:hypothetical protein